MQQAPERLPLTPRQIVLRQRLFHHSLQAPAQAGDAVDDTLDRQIEIGRKLAPDRLEEPIDVVALFDCMTRSAARPLFGTRSRRATETSRPLRACSESRSERA
jgi:hypothetical protein